MIVKVILPFRMRFIFSPDLFFEKAYIFTVVYINVFLNVEVERLFFMRSWWGWFMGG
jgi:hypothetical protein